VNRRNVSHAACFKFGRFGFCKIHSSTAITELYNALFIVEQLLVWAGKIAIHNMCWIQKSGRALVLSQTFVWTDINQVSLALVCFIYKLAGLLYTIYYSVLMNVFQKLENYTRILRYTVKYKFVDRSTQTWRSKNSRVGGVVSAIFPGFTLWAKNWSIVLSNAQ
jgi:hypothetical protein